ncbi:seryl-tRNA synthetase, partial [Acrasis kona]
MLDINAFRINKGGNPDAIRLSQGKRFADVTLVDQVVELDEQWKNLRSRLDTLNLYSRIVSTHVGQKKKAKQEEGDPTLPIPQHIIDQFDEVFKKENQQGALSLLSISQLVKLSKYVKSEAEMCEKNLKEKITERDSKLHLIGNIVHPSVPI